MSDKKCDLLRYNLDCIGNKCPFADVFEVPIKSKTIQHEFSIPETLFLENNQPRIARHIAYILGVKKVEIESIKKIGYVFYDIQRSVAIDVKFKIIIHTTKCVCSLEGN